MKSALAGLLLALLAVPSLASKLDKYKNWAESPQGYFMTRAERTQWTAVQNDEQAAAFVQDFIARRGGQTFVDEVVKRAAKADQYLTIGKTPGSQTLRGKVIILFGPPAAMDVSQYTQTSTTRDSAESSAQLSNMNAGVGGGRGEASTSDPNHWLGTAKALKGYHFNYRGDVAKLLKRDSFDVIIEADANTGADHPATRDDSKLLDEAFEAAAQASLTVNR
jgi:GWxTD domain-containing protein